LWCVLRREFWTYNNIPQATGVHPQVDGITDVQLQRMLLDLIDPTVEVSRIHEGIRTWELGALEDAFFSSMRVATVRRVGRRRKGK
jgi:hypothetical protein